VLTPAEALLMIAAAPDQRSMLRETTEQARHIIGAHQAVSSLTVDKRSSQTVISVSLSDKYAAWRNYDEVPNGSGIYRLVCEVNRPMRLTQRELEAHPAWRGFGASAAQHPPMRGWLAVPLIGGTGRNLGLIQLSDKYEGDFTEEDAEILGQLARLASVAIEKGSAEAAQRAALEELRRKEEKLHRLAQELVLVREEERKRLGFDLHDNVCQELVGISILVDSARQHIEAEAPHSADDLARAVRYLHKLMEHLRMLARDLRPMQLSDLGLEEALRALAAGVTSPETAVVTVFPVSIPRLDEHTEVAVYRVAQEALTNALRHAAARAIVVTLTIDDGQLCLDVRDDGRGFDVQSRPARALGIASIEERALAQRGRLAITSRPGRGTTVRFECPLR
jgi:signal transduction histidine kinase